MSNVCELLNLRSNPGIWFKNFLSAGSKHTKHGVEFCFWRPHPFEFNYWIGTTITGRQLRQEQCTCSPFGTARFVQTETRVTTDASRHLSESSFKSAILYAEPSTEWLARKRPSTEIDDQQECLLHCFGVVL